MDYEEMKEFVQNAISNKDNYVVYYPNLKNRPKINTVSLSKYIQEYHRYGYTNSEIMERTVHDVQHKLIELLSLQNKIGEEKA